MNFGVLSMVVVVGFPSCIIIVPCEYATCKRKDTVKLMT